MRNIFPFVFMDCGVSVQFIDLFSTLISGVVFEFNQLSRKELLSCLSEVQYEIAAKLMNTDSEKGIYCRSLKMR